MFIFYIGLPFLCLVSMAIAIRTLVASRIRAVLITATAFSFLFTAYLSLLCGEWRPHFARNAVNAFLIAMVVAVALRRRGQELME